MVATILITGANGQVGQELAAAQSPHRLIALTRAELDITDPHRVAAVVGECHPDIVINAAAYTRVDQAEADAEQAFAVNRDGVVNLASACRARDLPLLHVSTDYIFSGEEQGEYHEDDDARPVSVYGESKLAGERALRDLLPRHVILRTSWVFSAHGNNFVKTMLRLGRERSELGIVDDQRGCPTSARSIAAALLRIADACLDDNLERWGTYHFCNSPATSWFDFAGNIFRQAQGYDDLRLRSISTAEYPTPARRPMNSVLNCDRLEAAFGIARSDWRDELSLVLEALES